ncbi:hypothetical protein [Amantichitinum ursilacus]|uniref:DUF2726 domain-containing protein n=1 Tax=Amantichitinum ursilacus TaxID=857265 RepID=A0A0N0XMU7_9NEIS|nr:hypothetical protein [Amantichitinum ursilacus]KPC55376.1 hypothetical protein WG78_01925 [Amantichitinum ursilacus]
MRSIVVLFLALISLYSTPVFAVKVWECVAPNGVHVFQDKPCLNDTDNHSVNSQNVSIPQRFPQNNSDTRISAAPVLPAANAGPVVNTAHPGSVRIDAFSLIKPLLPYLLVVSGITIAIGIFGQRSNRNPWKTGRRKAGPDARMHFMRKKWLSLHERQMYRLLTELAPPEWAVFVQVSICNRNLDIVLVIELDDVTHIGKEEKDRTRDGFLAEAGISTRRFYHVPPAADLRAMFADLLAKDGMTL